MRAEIIAVLILVMVSTAAAALDQSYIHTVSRDGTSVMEKTMELSVFSNKLTPEMLGKMADLCRTDRDLDCDVDVEGKKITIRENFSSGGYYTFTTDYGLPDVTYTLAVRSLPSDRFSATLDKLLVGAGVTEAASGSASPLELTDKEANEQTASYLKFLKVKVTYSVTMPAAISEASAGSVAGEVSGDSATFDLLKVMEESEPITVKSSELNLGYIVGIIGIVVLVAMAAYFLYANKPAEKAPKKRK